MHELSIVTHVAKTLDEIALENNLKKIGSVTLEIGEVSGIMTDYFEDCWNYFKVKHPLLKESILKIEMVPAITFCEDCKQDLVEGNECNIKEIEAED